MLQFGRSGLLLFAIFSSVHWTSKTEIPNLYYVTDKRLTSDVNLERFFILEEDLLSNVEVLMRDDYFEAADEETQEEHEKHKPDLTPIESIMGRTKSIHADAEKDMRLYLSHPVNVYHLVRRLQNDWNKGLDVVLKTRLCREWKVPGMVRHLNYVQRQLPGAKEVGSVISFLAHQLKMFGPKGPEVAVGKVGNYLATQPLDIEDQFIIARSLHEQEDFRSAIQWLGLISDWFGQADLEEKKELSFNFSTVLNIMASAYYQANNPVASVKTLERVLKADPSNRLANNNMAFFQSKAEKQQEENERTGQEQKRKRGNSKEGTDVLKAKFERLCTEHKVTKLSRHSCVLEPVTPHKGWDFYRKEILRVKPPIFIYRDFIGKKTADELKDYSFNTISDRSWSSDYFRLPRLRLVFDYTYIYPSTLREKARQTAQRLRHLSRPRPYLLKSWGAVEVFTSGLEGMHLKDYMEPLDLVPLGDEKQVGAFFLFLSEAKQGGQVVMTSRNLVVEPSKGSVLFYHPTRSRPHSYCPAIGGSVWTAIQPFYDRDPKECPLQI